MSAPAESTSEVSAPSAWRAATQRAMRLTEALIVAEARILDLEEQVTRAGRQLAEQARSRLGCGLPDCAHPSCHALRNPVPFVVNEEELERAAQARDDRDAGRGIYADARPACDHPEPDCPAGAGCQYEGRGDDATGHPE